MIDTPLVTRPDGRGARVRETLVSIVAPVYNESATLAEFIRRLAEVCDSLTGRYAFEFVLVDDGSTDSSLECAKALGHAESRLRLIELRRNFGQTAALQAGLTAATGDIIVSMDSDLQHFPRIFRSFWRNWRKATISCAAGIISAKRTPCAAGRHGWPTLSFVASRACQSTTSAQPTGPTELTLSAT